MQLASNLFLSKKRSIERNAACICVMENLTTRLLIATKNIDVHIRWEVCLHHQLLCIKTRMFCHNRDHATEFFYPQAKKYQWLSSTSSCCFIIPTYLVDSIAFAFDLEFSRTHKIPIVKKPKAIHIEKLF